MKNVIIDEERSFKGVWIPKELYCDPNLNCREVFLLAEIQSLCELGQCFASNQHFADYLGVSKPVVEKMISKLRNQGYISTEVYYKLNSKEVEKRVITLPSKTMVPTLKKEGTPPLKNDGDKNTYIKNTKEEYINKNNEQCSGTEHKPGGENLIGYKEDDTLKDDFELEVDKWHWKSDKAYRDYIEKVLPKYIQEIATEGKFTNKNFIPIATKIFTRYFYYYRVNRGEYHPWYTKQRLKNILDYFFERGMSEQGQGNIDLDYLDSYYRKFFTHRNMKHDYHMEVFATDGMLNILDAELNCGGYGEWQEVL